MRNLASIQKIVSVVNHSNADRLDIAQVLGWKCIVGRNEFKAGDLVVYVEVDSVMPDEPQFTEIRKRSNRIKTIRLRGELSQGLCLPLKVLEGRKYPNDVRENPTYDLTEGTDVTALLGVTKWEPAIPACLAGDVEGPFPDFIPKTDEIRIQSIPEILQRYPGVKFVVTEKLDGSSCTMLKLDGKFRICGRNWEFKESNMNTFRQVAVRENYVEKLPAGYAVQGELVGPGIQGNPLKLKDHQIFIFNVFDINEHRYLDHDSMTQFIEVNGFKSVPVVTTFSDLSTYTVDDLIKLFTRKSSFNNEVWAEGGVFRPMTEMRDPDLGRLSFKCINPEYLLGEK